MQPRRHEGTKIKKEEIFFVSPCLRREFSASQLGRTGWQAAEKCGLMANGQGLMDNRPVSAIRHEPSAMLESR
jgi:hypothetical protein